MSSDLGDQGCQVLAGDSPDFLGSQVVEAAGEQGAECDDFLGVVEAAEGLWIMVSDLDDALGDYEEAVADDIKVIFSSWSGQGLESMLRCFGLDALGAGKDFFQDEVQWFSHCSRPSG